MPTDFHLFYPFRHLMSDSTPTVTEYRERWRSLTLTTTPPSTERDDDVSVRLLRGPERAEAERHRGGPVLFRGHDGVRAARRHQPQTHRRPSGQTAGGTQNTGADPVNLA